MGTYLDVRRRRPQTKTCRADTAQRKGPGRDSVARGASGDVHSRRDVGRSRNAAAQ
jgi:hypothetical protein